MFNKAIHQLSNLSAGYYAPLWVPVVTQLVYRWARNNIYQNISKDDPLTEDRIKQRDAQHQLFVILAGVETLTFFAFSIFNRSYLIPACYTLAHLAWTDYSKRQEKYTSDYLESMDGRISFVK